MNKTEQKLLDKQIATALAWVSGTIGTHQAAHDLGITNNERNVVPRLAPALREAYKRGLLVIKK